ncbi:MAG: transcription-repair coupling factor [bacterium]|nr:transcription-repair coupling factor [bacterium]
MFESYIKNQIIKFLNFNKPNPSISGVNSTALSLFVVEIFENITCLTSGANRPSNILYIADDTVDIHYIKSEVEFFLKDKNTEVLAMPVKSSGRRAEFFEKVLTNTAKIIIVNNSMLLEPALSIRQLSEPILTLEKSGIYNREELIKDLVICGLSRQDEVYEKGDFSVRGEILDFWAYDNDHPFRLIFNDDEIEAIYNFDITTQRRKDKLDQVYLRNLLEGDDGQIVMDYFSFDKFFCLYGKSYVYQTSYLLKKHKAVEIEPFTQNNIYDAKMYPMYSFKGVFDLFIKQLKEFQDKNYHLEIVLHKHAEIKNLEAAIDSKLKNLNLTFSVGSLREGFFSAEHKKAIFTEKDIFDREIIVESQTLVDTKNVFNDSSIDYKAGDLVVHSNYGVGKFLGFKQVKIAENTSEYITIEYAKKDKLYVPVHDFNLIHKYASHDASFNLKLDSLDGVAWKKTKERVEKRIFEMADEIIAIQAKRKQIQGIVFKEDLEYEQDFASSFPYDETRDQGRVIQEVLFDMAQSTSMERLVCGDVGYGKTEVAIRAIFRAAINGYQVVFIAPTTILVKQHFNNLKNRFMNYPVTLGVLSRFSTLKDKKQVKEDLQNGKIDVLLSTHAVLRKTTSFFNLGLVIIDEEHRFGVKDKERLKRLANNVDMLYLSATPIPRTLSMSLNGVKDISVIETPPPNRREISTYIGKYDKVIIQDAINFELNRDGQVFYIYNHVEDIELKYQEIIKLAPKAKIAIAHGQMTNIELDNVMTKFFNKEINVLLSTTIVESGLDIPSMNMMIIDGAQRLGLAQLYQLRGRVGRGYAQSFCYIFYPANINLKENAIKRLQAMQSFQGFGGGFKLALRDLEIRGAGNILGKKQHGYIKEVGFELYLEMLNRALDGMKDKPGARVNTEINLSLNAYLPDSYIKNSAIRLYFYKLLLNIRNTKDIEDIEIELLDRFGKLPLVVNNFFELARLRLISKSLELTLINEVHEKIIIEFSNVQLVNIDKLLELSHKYSKHLRFRTDKLNGFEIFSFPKKKYDKLIFIKKILQELVEK